MFILRVHEFYNNFKIQFHCCNSFKLDCYYVATFFYLYAKIIGAVTPTKFSELGLIGIFLWNVTIDEFSDFFTRLEEELICTEMHTILLDDFKVRTSKWRCNKGKKTDVLQEFVNLVDLVQYNSVAILIK